MNELKAILETQSQLILTGPPGTGKTLLAKQVAVFMETGGIPAPTEVEKQIRDMNDRIQIIQFHPSYNYDDFVQGIRIRSEGNGHLTYPVLPGPLLRMANLARNNPNQNFILVIDEINRANVAAVLGEMIYALEYRGQPVRLQYGEAPVSLPENLYIIGTMNTSDRSIGHLDYAVRRRFAFHHIAPSSDAVSQIQNQAVRQAALDKFSRVAALFTGDTNQLSSDYNAADVQPGHSYFLANDIPGLNRKMKYQIGPLLREYVADGVLKPGALDAIQAIEAAVQAA